MASRPIERVLCEKISLNSVVSTNRQTHPTSTVIIVSHVLAETGRILELPFAEVVHEPEALVNCEVLDLARVIIGAEKGVLLVALR